MTFAEMVLDFPVLVQGLLGSFLFWVIYEIGKRGTNLALTLLGKFSNRVKKELKTALFFHHAHSVLNLGGSSKNTAFLVSIHLALNRLIHAIIFACFGAIASLLFGSISIVAYMIAIGYLFLALRAVQVDFGPTKPIEFHQKEMDRLGDEIAPTQQPDKPGAAEA